MKKHRCTRRLRFLRRAIGCAALLGVFSHGATVYYVDPGHPDADDAQPGTLAAPWKTVQHAMDQAQPGDTVYLRAGVYRQQFTFRRSGRAEAPITVAAAPGEPGRVWFKGTEVVAPADMEAVTTPRGTAWVLPYPRSFHIMGKPENRVFRDDVDQVFVDDEFLPGVPERALLEPGRFWVERDAEPARLWFMPPPGKNPAEARVEVSRLQWAIRFDPHDPEHPAETARYEHIHLRGLSFHGFATHPRSPVIQFTNVHHSRMEDCTIRWSNGRGIGLRDCSDVTLARNDISHCGQLAIGGSRLERLTLEDNITNFNNYKRYSVWWECGGVKLLNIRDSVIRRHVAVGNEGQGLWLDWRCRNNRIEDSLCAWNMMSGLLNEVADGTRIRNNIFAFNRVVMGFGTALSGSSDVRVENNIFYGNEGAAVEIGGGPGERAFEDDFVRSNRNRIERNLMAGNGVNLMTLDPIPGYCEDNHIDHNLYWSWTAVQPVVVSGRPTDFATWRDTSGHDRHSRIADPGFADPDRLDFRLPPSSPALAVGFDPAGMRLDWSEHAIPPPPAPPDRPAVVEAFFVDLAPFFNRALRDEEAGDGRGGWTDQGPNDLREFPAGDPRFEGIPFRIGQAEEAVVALECPRVAIPGAPSRVEIPVGRKADALYFLHAAAWTGGDTLFRYTMHAGDLAWDFPIRDGRELMDWWAPLQWQENMALERHGTFPAWRGSNPVRQNITVYATRWANPRPDLPIERVVFAVADRRAAPLLLAITGVTETE